MLPLVVASWLPRGPRRAPSVNGDVDLDLIFVLYETPDSELLVKVVQLIGQPREISDERPRMGIWLLVTQRGSPVS